MAEKLGWQQPNLSRFESENYSSQTIAKITEFVGILGIYLHVMPSITEEPRNIIFKTVKPMKLPNLNTSSKLGEDASTGALRTEECRSEAKDVVDTEIAPFAWVSEAEMAIA